MKIFPKSPNLSLRTISKTISSKLTKFSVIRFVLHNFGYITESILNYVFLFYRFYVPRVNHVSIFIFYLCIFFKFDWMINFPSIQISHIVTNIITSNFPTNLYSFNQLLWKFSNSDFFLNRFYNFKNCYFFLNINLRNILLLIHWWNMYNFKYKIYF